MCLHWRVTHGYVMQGHVGVFHEVYSRAGTGELRTDTLCTDGRARCAAINGHTPMGLRPRLPSYARNIAPYAKQVFERAKTGESRTGHCTEEVEINAAQAGWRSSIYDEESPGGADWLTRSTGPPTCNGTGHAARSRACFVAPCWVLLLAG
jgi:hypothetical protein